MYGLAAAIYIELATLGWSLLGDIFICQPRRSARQSVCRVMPTMQCDTRSCTAPLSVPQGQFRRDPRLRRTLPFRGKVRITSDPNYRGEAYLQGSRGAAKIDDWSMSRVGVHVEADGDDRLVLNQNYSPGWKAIRRAGHGKIKRPAGRSQRRRAGLAGGRPRRSRGGVLLLARQRPMGRRHFRDCAVGLHWAADCDMAK